MRSKLFGLLVVLALLLGTVGTAFAQDLPAPYCGDLAAADCELLTNSQQVMMAVKSYKASATYDATLTGIPGLPATEVNVNVAVDGAFSMDDAALAAAQGFAGKTQEEIVMALAEDATPLTDVVNGTNFDITIDAMLTPELAAAFTAQAGGITVPESASIGLMMVDGVLYVNLSDLATVVAGIPEGWLGIPFGELVAAQVDAGAFTMAADQLSAASADPSTAAAMGLQSILMGDQKAFEKFLTVSRGEDTTVDGNAAAVFTSKLDVAGLVGSPEFAAIVKELSNSGALGETGMTEADIDQGLQMLAMMGPMIFQGLDVSVVRTIGIDNGYWYEQVNNFVWDLSGLIQMAAMSGQLPEGIQAGDAVAVSLVSDVQNSDFDAEQNIEAPADAMMIPVEALMGTPAQ